MAIAQPYKQLIQDRKKEYDQLRQGKDSLLQILDEAEIPESVYNSNAIENSTLTLKETEKILMQMELSRDVDLREVYEAKNLARVIEYLRQKTQDTELTNELILLLYEMLLGIIDDRIAGRYRMPGEYVRVGTHIAPAPEKITPLLNELLLTYSSDDVTYFLERLFSFISNLSGFIHSTMAMVESVGC